MTTKGYCMVRVNNYHDYYALPHPESEANSPFFDHRGYDFDGIRLRTRSS